MNMLNAKISELPNGPTTWATLPWLFCEGRGPGSKDISYDQKYILKRFEGHQKSF